MATPIPAFHVTLTSRSGHVVEGVYQYRTQEAAEEYAATMRGMGYTADVAEGPLKTEKIPARQLNGSEVLANGGVIIDRVYFGVAKVRVTGFTHDFSRIVRRAYDWDQLVEIEARR